MGAPLDVDNAIFTLGVLADYESDKRGQDEVEEAEEI